MNPPMEQSFNRLVARYLGRPLPGRLTEAISMPAPAPDLAAFITRMLILMQKAGFPATDFSPLLIWQLSNVIPGFLPCAWNGEVPPLTLPKRNARIDSYIACHEWTEAPAEPVFVDMGCAFPPITTMDSAEALSGWRVFGIDLWFPDYVLYDSKGNYACFKTRGLFQYFQPKMDSTGIQMYKNAAKVRLQFEKAFEELYPLLPKKTPTGSQSVENNGYKLIRDPIRDYEAPSVRFIQSGIEDILLPPAHAIRCMNTLIYFDSKTRNRMLAKAGALLADGGTLIAGTNLMNGSNSRYIVYGRDNSNVEPREFALSIDNLRSINVMPWYTMHDDDPEALLAADLIRRVRSDRRFWHLFSARVDELMASYDLFRRDKDGFFKNPQCEWLTPDFSKRASLLWRQIEEEGFTDGAVEVLNRAGCTAWKNPVGDIAVRPDIQPLTLPG